MTPEECIARGIAPIKPQYLKPPPAPPPLQADTDDGSAPADGGDGGDGGEAQARVR